MLCVGTFLDAVEDEGDLCKNFLACSDNLDDVMNCALLLGKVACFPGITSAPEATEQNQWKMNLLKTCFLRQNTTYFLLC